ncbi:MAG TPA: hypothetical protein DIT50_01730 [Rhodocyclaceae bacterium]|nr:hypothetical protein [Rhodocyclaceae bacterium]
MSPKFLLVLASVVALTGCDALYDALEIPNPNKVKAEAKAIGAACRHSGRSLEDCYYLHPDLEKAAIYEGWREMNEYMLEKELPTVPAQLVPNEPQVTAKPLERNEPLIPSLARPANGQNASAPAPAAAGGGH